MMWRPLRPRRGQIQTLVSRGGVMPPAPPTHSVHVGRPSTCDFPCSSCSDLCALCSVWYVYRILLSSAVARVRGCWCGIAVPGGTGVTTDVRRARERRERAVSGYAYGGPFRSVCRLSQFRNSHITSRGPLSHRPPSPKIRNRLLTAARPSHTTTPHPRNPHPSPRPPRRRWPPPGSPPPPRWQPRCGGATGP